MRNRFASLLLLTMLCLFPRLATAQQVTAVTVNPVTVVGGTTITGTITLAASPTANMFVFVSSSNATVSDMPHSVFMPAGSSPSVTVPIATNPVATNQTITVSAVSTGTAATATFTVTPGFTRIFSPTDDAYVRAGNDIDPVSGKPYGDTTYQTYDPLNLVVKTDALGVYNINRAAYLKFDLTGLQTAPTGASLHLSSVVHSNGGTMNILCYSVPNTYANTSTAWTESGLTCNNAPGLNLTNFTSTGTLLNQQNLTQTDITVNAGLIPFDLTSFIRSHVGQIVTIQIMEEETAPFNPYSAEFHSKESTSGQPTLALTFDGIQGEIPLAPWSEVGIAYDAPGSGGQGSSSADGIVLASGVYENTPDPDIVVRNPYGAPVTYTRTYRSYLAGKGYSSPGLSVGWVDNYDLKIAVSPGGATVKYPNGGQETLQAPLYGSTSFFVPSGAPYLLTGTPDPAHSGQWLSLIMTLKDESKLTFLPAGANIFMLSQITDIVGNSLAINRDASLRPTSIVSTANANAGSASMTLLTFDYSASSVTKLLDAYSRQVNLNFDGNGLLIGSSQIVASGTANPPTRWSYGYTVYFGQPVLTNVGAPDPRVVNGPILNHPIPYDINMRVPVLTDNSGNQNLYTYNANSTTTVQTQDALQNVAMTYTQLLSYPNLDGGISIFNSDLNNTVGTSNAYDGVTHLPVSSTNELGQTATLTYDPNSPNPVGNLKTVTVPCNGSQLQTTYTYDYGNFALGRLVQVQVGGKTPTKFTYYDGTTQANGVTQVNGLLHEVYTPVPGNLSGAQAWVKTTYTYTALGNVATVTVPASDGTPVTYMYNYTSGTYWDTYYSGDTYTTAEALDEPLSVADPLGHKFYAQYDARGNVLSAWSDFLTDLAFYPNADTNIFNDAQFYNYNIADQLSGYSLRLGVTYPIGTPDNDGQVYNTYAYAGGPLLSSALYQGIYDDNDGIPDGLTPILWRQINYTAGPEDEDLGISGAVPQVSASYDGLYRLSKLTDGKGSITQHSFNSVGDLKQRTYPLYNNLTGSDNLQLGHDAAHNLISRIDGLNRNILYNHASDDSRLTSVAYPPGASGTIPNANYLYDNYGRISDAFDGNQPLPAFATYHLQYAYDDLDNVVSVTTTYKDGFGNALPAQVVSYVYNPDGSRGQMMTPAGNYTYVYDKAGRMTGITFPWNQTVSYTYFDNNWLKNQYQSKFHTHYSYWATGQLGFEHNVIGAADFLNNNGNNLACFDMDYWNLDAAGNPLLVVRYDYSDAQSYPQDYSAYSYDNHDRITQEKSVRGTNPAANYQYNYASDEANNLVTLRSSVTGYNADNQLSGLGYDGDGNSTYFGNFDIEDRLISSSGISAGYRDDGLRAWKQTSTGRTYFIYDGEQLVYAFGGTQGPVAYGYGVNGLVQRFANGVYTAYTFDPSGNLVSRYRQQDNHPTQNDEASPYDVSYYDAFGQFLGCFLPDTIDFGLPFTPTPIARLDEVGFGGQWGGYTDMETGLVLMGHRYYSPYYGRFISRDPIGYDGGINLYAYADNNPITHADPSGLNWLTEHAKAFGRWVGRKTRAVGNGLCDLIKAPFIAGMKMDYKKQPSLQMAYRGFDIADEVNGRYARAGHAVNEYIEDTGGMIALTAAFGALRFSQVTAGVGFSEEGAFVGKSIGTVAAEIRSGALAPSQVPVKYVLIEGNPLIVNTRSSLALMRAGVPQSEWTLINVTNDADEVTNIVDRLQRNGLTSTGTRVLRITGLGKNASNLR